MSKHRIITNGKTFKVQTKKWGFWGTEYSLNCSLAGDYSVDIEHKTKEESEKWIKMQYGKKAEIVRKWRPA